MINMPKTHFGDGCNGASLLFVFFSTDVTDAAFATSSRRDEHASGAQLVGVVPAGFRFALGCLTKRFVDALLRLVYFLFFAGFAIFGVVSTIDVQNVSAERCEYLLLFKARR